MAEAFLLKSVHSFLRLLLLDTILTSCENMLDSQSTVQGQTECQLNGLVRRAGGKLRPIQYAVAAAR
jgi:hypothetical protein